MIENCSNSWKWQKRIIVQYSYDMKKPGGVIKKYYKQEPEAVYANQIQNWG